MKRVLGLVPLGFGIWILHDFPFARWPLLLGAGVYLGVLLWRPALWLILLPLLLPVLDLRPWTGRIYLDEFDALVLVTLAAYLLRDRYVLSFGAMRPLSRVLLVLFVGLMDLSLLRTLYPWPEVDANSFASYYSIFNGLRVSKGLFWALLLYPAWVVEERLDAARARRFLLLGMSLAALAVFAVVLWERGIYSTLLFWTDIYSPIRALLDFATPYRVTALFADMHTGDTAIDGWLLLALPFVAAAFLSARGLLGASLTGIALLGLLYTAFVTFSRGVYLGVFVAMAVAFLALAFQRRATIQARDIPFVALTALTMVGLSYIAFRSGGSVALAYMLTAFMSGALMMVIPGQTTWGRWRLAALVTLTAMLTLLCTWTILDRSYGFLPLPAVWQAMLCIPPAAFIGVWIGRRLAGRLALQQTGMILAVLAGVLFLMTLSLFGYRMDARLETVSQDLQHRLEHWRTAVSIMERDLDTRLLGQSIGGFPQTYYLMHQDPATVAGFRIEDAGSRRMLRLFGGPNIRIGQRLSLEPRQAYGLSLSLKTDEDPNPIQLDLRICHRHLVPAYEWNPTCATFNPRIQPNSTDWMRIEQTFDAQELGSFKGAQEGWLTLEIANRSVGRWIDIGTISILDAAGQELVDNGDFARGFDRWFLYSDFDHLPWHIKNLWVHVYFELGFIGLVLFVLIALVALMKTARSAVGLDSFALALLAALAGFYAVGVFGTIIDSPRVSTLFWLTTLLALGHVSITTDGYPGSACQWTRQAGSGAAGARGGGDPTRGRGGV